MAGVARSALPALDAAASPAHGRIRARSERRQRRSSSRQRRSSGRRSLEALESPATVRRDASGASASWTADSPLFAGPGPISRRELAQFSRGSPASVSAAHDSMRRRTPSMSRGSNRSRRSSGRSPSRMSPGQDGRPETSPMRPQSSSGNLYSSAGGGNLYASGEGMSGPTSHQQLASGSHFMGTEVCVRACI